MGKLLLPTRFSRIPSGLVIAAVNALGSLLAFGHHIWIQRIIGPGNFTDTMYFAVGIPQFLVVVGSFAFYNQIISRYATLGKGDRDTFRRKVRGTFTGIYSLLGVTVWLSSVLWMSHFLSGFSPAEQNSLSLVILLQIFSVPFHGLLLAETCLQSENKDFIRMECAAFMGSCLVFAFLISRGDHLSIVPAAAALASRPLITCLLLYTSQLFKKGDEPSKAPLLSTAKESGFQIRDSIGLVGTGALAKSDMLIDRFLLVNSQPGDLSILYLAQQLLAFGMQALNRGYAAPVIPQLSRLFQQGERSAFQNLLRRRLKILALLSLAIMIGIAAVGAPLIGFILTSKDPGHAENSQRIWIVTILLFGYLFGGCLGYLLNGAVHAKRDSRSALWIAFSGFFLSLAMKISGVWLWGLNGIALAISIHYLISMFRLYRSTQRAQDPTNVSGS